MNAFKCLIFLLLLFFQSCSSQIEKIKGVSFVASRESITNDHTSPLVDINANYAAVMPFGFIRDLSHPEIVFNTNRQWFGETEAGVKQYSKALSVQHIKIMLKPQIWVWHGLFTGHIAMKDEKSWKQLEDSYSKFILSYAELAKQINADIFCIGTELEQFIMNRPDYWKRLILEIKKRYDGKLTYAANWDEFKRVPFWGDMDYIGVDAYFPVSDSRTPTLEACLVGWKKHKSEISTLSSQYDKPVLFTEFGYRSVDYAAKEPWKSDRGMTQVNLAGQRNATQALFEAFWQEDWFAGGFVWKWHHNHETAGGNENTQFTPQNKPVEALIKSYFSKS
ncbi:glycoside hydrolase family 113 [Snuella sedimenti]|uniref:Glycoside hydrolase n=1 Tax=Snuella sedimenti TaxID=2798802 RepID=A0A8J7JBE5_9FLAO|nr:glycoside hydrolase [Snuella sedimenti]MBJ6367999.1 glycoside hydrolase [Snuella sedimenti]